MSGNRPDEADSARPQSEAEAAAARIAELVRRSNERRQQPAPGPGVDQQPAPGPGVDQPPGAEGDAAGAAEGRGERGPVATPPTAGAAAAVSGADAGAAAGPGAAAGAGAVGGAGAAVPPETATERTAELPAVPGPPAYPDGGPLPTRSSRAGEPSGGGSPRRPLPALPGGRRVVAALAALGAVAVAVAVWLVAANGGEPPAAKPKPSPTVLVPGGYTVRASDTVTDCRANSRGKVQQAFAATPCRSVERYLATGAVGGRPVLYVVSRIRMPSASDAAAIKVVIDGTGTGNINDLLREGVTYPGAPPRMPRSGYASLQDGDVLVVAEAGFTDGGATSNADPQLRAAAAAAANHVVDLAH